MVQVNELASYRKFVAIAGVKWLSQNIGYIFVTHPFEHTLRFMNLLVPLATERSAVHTIREVSRAISLPGGR